MNNKIVNKIKFLTIILILTALNTTLAFNTLAYPTEETPEAITDGLYPPQQYLDELEKIQNEIKETTIFIIIPSGSELIINETTAANIIVFVHEETEKNKNPSISDEENKTVTTPETSKATTTGGTTTGLKAK